MLPRQCGYSLMLPRQCGSSMKRLWLAGLALAAAWNCTTEQDNVFAACQVALGGVAFFDELSICGASQWRVP